MCEIQHTPSYTIIHHFTFFTRIYNHIHIPNGILCQVHKFRSNRGTLCPLAKVGSDIVGLGDWHHIMGFESVHEVLLYDPHSIRFSSRINSAVYLEACSSAHMQILSYSIKTHVAHVIFFHKRERTDFELISQRLPDVKLS